MSGLNLTTESLLAVKSDETTSWTANTMRSANSFFEVLIKTTKNYTNGTRQINSGSTLLVSGAQLTHSLLAMHCFCFTGHSNLRISSGIGKVEQVTPSFTEGTKAWGFTVLFKVSQSVNDKVYLTSLL